MMNIIITGKNSYVGNNLSDWLSQGGERYNISFLSLRDENWKLRNFTGIDVVIHLAAIVHLKEIEKNKKIYNEINRDLTFELAKKSKEAKVKHFVFLSSMSVYGLEGKTRGMVTIDDNTVCNPNTYYGKSKLEAEHLIGDLQDDYFKISIIRAPMIYGRNCPGNYSKLRKLALLLPIFPQVSNERSMIYVDNLSEFIKKLIDNPSNGVFFPQNSEYVCTSKLVELIALNNGKKISLSKSLGKLLIFNQIKIINKIFGSLKYDTHMSSYEDFSYCIFDLKSSVKLSERKENK